MHLVRVVRYDTCMDPFQPSRQLLEVASWRLVAELVRRHPALRVIETHPGGGMYDCLQVLLDPHSNDDRPAIVLNRAGSVHVLGGDTAADAYWETFWADYLSADDPRRVLDRLCGLAGLPPVRRLPPSSDATVVYSFIAAFLSSAVFGRDRWECRNGSCDSSLGSELSTAFAAFPAARARLLERRPGDILDQPAYRFWFLIDDAPQLCLETCGQAWDREGNEFDLGALYRTRRRLWPLVNFVARDLLY